MSLINVLELETLQILGPPSSKLVPDLGLESSMALIGHLTHIILDA